MANHPHAITDEFETPDQTDWMALVEKTLKGKPFEKAMMRTSADGLEISALNTKAEAIPDPQPFRAEQNWLIASPNWGSDPEVVNKDILMDLERGASAIALTVGAAEQGISPASLDRALGGVYLELVPINLIQGEGFAEGARHFEALLKESRAETGKIVGCLGVDPIGTLARQGRLSQKAEAYIAEGASMASHWHQKQPGVVVFTADGTVVSNAAGSEVDELSFALSSALQYLRAMEAEGLALEIAAQKIQFTFSADADLWLTVAKFRSARRVWQFILAACGVKGVPMHINAVSAVHKVTNYDPWVNILRGTAACFAAVVGGADMVTILPHDLMRGTTDEFSRRIARNIQIILQEESNLGRVLDPAAGSFAIEKLTADMTAKTLEQFQALEGKGGALAALRDGSLADTIGRKAEQREAALRKRKKPLTGLSEFPNIQEEPLIQTPPSLDDGPTEPESAETVTPLYMRRASQAYEELRAFSDAIFQQEGKRPSIFLANLGTPADYTARATFAKNFFEAGGIEALAGEGASSAHAIADQYEKSAARIAVICGQDMQYGELAEGVAQELKAQGCSRVYIAGPEMLVRDHESIDDCVFLGADLIDTVSRAYASLGYAREGDKS